jgi:hypothetical protein
MRFNQPKTINREEFFWSLVDKNGPIPSHLPHLAPCWIWKGPRIYGDYDRFSLEVAHRVSWRLVIGTEIPRPFVLDHLCVNPPCVNPAHLEVVSHSVNIARGVAWRARMKAIFNVAPKGTGKAENFLRLQLPDSGQLADAKYNT